jgi:hypothetical protein
VVVLDAVVAFEEDSIVVLVLDKVVVVCDVVEPN